MDKNKKISSQETILSQSCFFLVLLPSAIALVAFIVWILIEILNSEWWYGLRATLIVSGIFITCLAVVIYLTWRVGRKKFRSFQVRQEYARIERLIEKQESPEEDEFLKENHFPQNEQNSL